MTPQPWNKVFIAVWTLTAISSVWPLQGQEANIDPTVTGSRQLTALSGNGWQFFGATDSDALPADDSDQFRAASWTDISVPHVFQTRTDMSLAQGWYRRNITISQSLAHRHLYLIFEGAAAIADVYVNGRHLGQHRGAYTRFVFDATSALHVGDDNQLAILVDNRKASTKDCLPNGNRLYTVWGGLYRHVWLLATNYVHVDPTYYGSPGVFITPSDINETSAKVRVKVLVRNSTSTPQTATITATILDPSNREIKILSGQTSITGGQTFTVNLTGSIMNPLLWMPASPNLYHVRVDVAVGQNITDSVLQPLGFRNFNWDLKEGTAQVNGKPFTLYGVDLHQEIEKKASALDPEDFVSIYNDLQDLGVNFIRLPHYPHAEIEYDLCDKRGMFCWAENGHSNNEKPSPTADRITTEMVEQNYNHPSIIVWSVGNESSDDTAQAEAPVVKALDTTRPVMAANMKHKGDTPDAVDFRTKNIYPGWYGGSRFSFKAAGLITEVGAGGVVTSHTDYFVGKHNVNSYEPEEYQQLVAEFEFESAFRHGEGKLGMFTWWVFREFNDNKYKSALAPMHHGINSKGLETFAGDKKDVYYLYRSFLRPDVPTLHITSKRYFLRQGSVDNGIKVYSNAQNVTLKLNGETVSSLRNGQYKQEDSSPKAANAVIDNVFYWNASLHTGKNTVEVNDDSGNSDSAVLYFEGSNGLPEIPQGPLPIKNLTSSNPSNPVYYMDMPIQPQWPVYDDFDSTADNSLDEIPDTVKGATWLALKRVTNEGQAADISFTAARPLTVYIICTAATANPNFVQSSNFQQVPAPSFRWRDNTMILTSAQLFSHHCAGEEQVKLPLGDRDALVLFKVD